MVKVFPVNLRSSGTVSGDIVVSASVVSPDDGAGVVVSSCSAGVVVSDVLSPGFAHAANTTNIDSAARIAAMMRTDFMA